LKEEALTTKEKHQNVSDYNIFLTSALNVLPAHCLLQAVLSFFVQLLTALNFRLHPSCGYSFRFVFRQNLKSANSLRSNKADL